MAKPKKSPVRVSKFTFGGVAGALLGWLTVARLQAGAVVVLVGLAIIAAYTFYLLRLRGRRRVAPGFSMPNTVLAMVVVSFFSLVGAYYFNNTFAWHPNGKVQKTVQDVTKGGSPHDANSKSDEVEAEAGDILRYTVTVSNIASNASNHYNDMAGTVMTDVLPADLQLVSDPSANTIVENIGTILPGKSVVKIYEVKLLKTVKDHAVLVNKACFTANSVKNDNPQSGCDVAYLLADNDHPGSSPDPSPNPSPNSSPNPSPNPNPGPNPTPSPISNGSTELTDNGSSTGGSSNTTVDLPTQLPNTGPSDIAVVTAFAVLGGYLVHEWYWFVKRSKHGRHSTR